MTVTDSEFPAEFVAACVGSRRSTREHPEFAQHRRDGRSFPTDYKDIGPMAQDFYKAFGLGLDNKHITTIDEGGVALAAIQGLYRQNRALERKNRTACVV